MAKKCKAPQPDADGYIRTGIYQRRAFFTEQTPDELKKESEAYLESLRSQPKYTIRQWLSKTRDEILESIKPFIVIDKKMFSGKMYYPSLIPGKRNARIAEEIASDSHEYTLDAVDAISCIIILEHNIDESDALATGSLDIVLNTACRFGRAIERMQVRQFEPIVATELSRRKKRGQRRKEETRLTQKQWEFVKKFIQRQTDSGFSATKACEQVSSQLLTGTFPMLKGQQIDISPKSLRNRWSKRNK